VALAVLGALAVAPAVASAQAGRAPAASAQAERVVATASAPNDPFFVSSGAWGQAFRDQWALPRIGFTPKGSGTSAWDIETGASRPVIVAILDTGLDYLHPDFHPRSVWRNPRPRKRGDPGGYAEDLVGWNFVEGNNNPWDDDGHGTFVAGLIGATAGNARGITGINWNVRIMPLKVMNVFGKGRAFNVARAIVYAADHGARIINLSVEGEHLTRTEQLAIDHAHAKGALVVVAAGNRGVDTTDRAPASFSRVLAVGAVDTNDKRPAFSNWGRHVRIAAPGVDILSLRARRSDFMLLAGAKDYKPGQAFVGPKHQLMRSSGTSFAAPMVSAVASLIWAKHPGLTNVQVERMLVMSADDVEAPGWDVHTGYGRLNARKALTAAPDRYLYAEVHRLAAAREDNRPVIQVFGTAMGSDLRHYTIELGQGEAPAQWKPVGGPRTQGVEVGLLGTIPIREITARGHWTVRVVARDGGGATRESRSPLSIK
jgi:subtilisin family serine protease